MVVLNRILAATDFSPASAVALSYARDFARSYDAELHVIHVVENLAMRYSPEVGFATPLLQDNLESAARRQIEALVTDDDRRTLRVTTALPSGVNAAAAIVEYAQQHSIDLIILGTHGRGALGRLLLGSTTERVVRTAGCPVLAVRERERDFIAPDALEVRGSVNA